MAAITIQAPAGPVTFIEALQARYDAAGDAHEILENTEFEMAKTPDGEVRKCHLRDAEGYLEEEQEHLERCILNQQPITWKDACILAAHIESIGSGFSAYTPEYQKTMQEPLARGLESLLVFIADEHDIEGRGPGFVSSVVGYARRRVLMRTGRPLEDAWLSKAA